MSEVWDQTVYVVIEGRITERQGVSKTRKGYWVQSPVGPIYVSAIKEFKPVIGAEVFNTRRAVLDKKEAVCIAMDQIADYKLWVGGHMARIAGLEAAL